MNFSRETYRTIGAITGLSIGLAVSWFGGQYFHELGGLVPAAILGAGATVIGGIGGEQFFDRRKS